MEIFMALDKLTLERLQTFVTMGDRIGYYSLLASEGDKYAALALGVVGNSTFSGSVANAFIMQASADNGTTLAIDTLALIGIELMNADFDRRAAGTEMTVDVIQDYHITVFANHGLPPEAWTAYVPLQLVDEESKDALWEAMLDGAFWSGAQEVLSNFFGASLFQIPELVSWLYSSAAAVATANTSAVGSNFYGGYDFAFNGVQIIGGDQFTDTLTGTAGSDVIMTFDGSLDYAHGHGGNDHIYGGASGDTLIGGDGLDRIAGGGGDDIVFGGDGHASDLDLTLAHSEWDDGVSDFLSGGEGNDNFYIYSERFVIESPIPELMYGEIDYVDSTDRDFAANFQFLDWSEHLQSFTLTSSMLEASIAAGQNDYGYSFGSMTLDYDGDEWTCNIVGFEYQDDMIIVAYVGPSVLSVLGGLKSTDLLPRPDVNGTSGDDNLFGTNGNEKFDGGAGDDFYYFSPFGGNDIIFDGGDPTSTDVLEFGDVALNTIHVGRGSGVHHYDMVLGFGNGDSATITSGFLESESVIEEVRFDDGTVWDVSDIRQLYLEQSSTDGGDTVYAFLESDDVIHLAGGNDTAYGYSGNDTLSGEAGDDVLIGEGGNDTLIGGRGNDTLIGGTGNEIYLYALGDGYDYLNDGDNSSSNVDVLRLTDLNQADVDFMRSGLSLIMTVHATGETIFINNQFSPDQNGYWGAERIDFADGSSWDNQRISDIGWVRGTADNDNLVGTWRQEILAGGGGDDSLTGDWGNDTYIFNAGDGNDTIHDWGNPDATDVLELGAGIAASSVGVARGTGSFWDIVLNFGTAGSVTIADGFYTAATVIEEVRFADNTIWARDDLQTVHLQQAVTSGADTIYGFIDRNDVMDGGNGNDSLTGFSGDDALRGGDGDDSLSGDDGNDILIGGAGSDAMAGGAGNDAFVFRPGFGIDTVAEFTAGAGTDDALEFGNTLFADFEAVLAAAAQVGSDTVIAFDAANSVTLKNVTLANLHVDDVRFVA